MRYLFHWLTHLADLTDRFSEKEMPPGTTGGAVRKVVEDLRNLLEMVAERSGSLKQVCCRAGDESWRGPDEALQLDSLLPGQSSLQIPGNG